MKNILLNLLFILTGFITFGQDLNCSDFKNGTFKVEITEPVEFDWKIIRDGNNQIEILSQIPEEYNGLNYSNGNQYTNINWIDECSYIITYDSTKSDLTESQKSINNAGGVYAELIKTEGRCCLYIASIVLNGEKLTMNGKYCKE